MTTILLPAGTAQLRYGDLADLIANALHDDPLKAGFAWFNLEKELAQAVMRGALMLRDPLTLGPHPMPIGAMRDDALVLLHDLRDFLKCRGIAVEVEQAQPEPPPAPAAQVEPVQAAPANTPDPLTTSDIAYCFAGLRWQEQEWKRPLGDKPKWLKPCVAIPGKQGVHETRWNPVLIGAELVRNGHVKVNRIRARFQTKPQLAAWLEAWKTYEADNFDTE